MNGIKTNNSNQNEAKISQMRDITLVSDTDATGKSEAPIPFCDDLAVIIRNMQDNYVDSFATAMAKYTEFLGDISKLKSALSACTTTSGEAGKMTVDFDKFSTELGLIIQKYNYAEYDQYRPDMIIGVGGGVLYTAPDAGDAGKADAEAMAKQLGLNPSCVKQVCGQYIVALDLTPLSEIMSSIYKKCDPDNGRTVVVLTMGQGEYDSWFTGATSQFQTIENTAQVLAERFSRANSNLDSLYKMLSSVISDITNMLNTTYNNVH